VKIWKWCRRFTQLTEGIRQRNWQHHTSTYRTKSFHSSESNTMLFCSVHIIFCLLIFRFLIFRFGIFRFYSVWNRKAVESLKYTSPKHCCEVTNQKGGFTLHQRTARHAQAHTCTKTIAVTLTSRHSVSSKYGRSLVANQFMKQAKIASLCVVWTVYLATFFGDE